MTDHLPTPAEPQRGTGGLAVVSALAAHGVTTVFGIPGTHNLELYRHLPAARIRAITPRHEQGAGYAADGYWLVTGQPGVVITTSGPGLTNVLTAAATAYAESRPMLIISPGVPTGFERADVGLLHETKSATEAFDNLLVFSHRARTVEGAVAAVDEAFVRFSTHRPGPVHIEIPLDVLEGPWNLSPVPGLPASRIAADDSTLSAAADALRCAERPLIIAGGGARGLADELSRLAECLGAPVVTTANGKGAIDERHRLAVGASVRFPSVQEESQKADVLLVLGSELADSDLWGGRIGARGVNSWDAVREVPGDAPGAHPQTVIRCDIDPDQLHKNLPGTILARTDCRSFVVELAQRLGDLERTGGAERAAQLREAWRAEFPPSIGARVTEAIQAAAGVEVIIGGDSSRVTYDGTVHALVAARDDQLLYMPGFATLGYGIPAAMGAKIADASRPVVAFVGDGAAMFSIQEVMTAVELGLALPIVIVDNGGYAEIEGQMEERGIEPFAVRLARPDFAALGTAFGAHGVTVDEADPHRQQQAVEGAVRTALAADRPTIIHVIEH